MGKSVSEKLLTRKTQSLTFLIAQYLFIVGLLSGVVGVSLFVTTDVTTLKLIAVSLVSSIVLTEICLGFIDRDNEGCKKDLINMLNNENRFGYTNLIETQFYNENSDKENIVEEDTDYYEKNDGEDKNKDEENDNNLKYSYFVYSDTAESNLIYKKVSKHLSENLSNLTFKFTNDFKRDKDFILKEINITKNIKIIFLNSRNIRNQIFINYKGVLVFLTLKQIDEIMNLKRLNDLKNETSFLHKIGLNLNNQ